MQKLSQWPRRRIGPTGVSQSKPRLGFPWVSLPFLDGLLLGETHQRLHLPSLPYEARAGLGPALPDHGHAVGLPAQLQERRRRANELIRGVRPIFSKNAKQPRPPPPPPQNKGCPRGNLDPPWVKVWNAASFAPDPGSQLLLEGFTWEARQEAAKTDIRQRKLVVTPGSVWGLAEFPAEFPAGFHG